MFPLKCLPACIRFCSAQSNALHRRAQQYLSTNINPPEISNPTLLDIKKIYEYKLTPKIDCSIRSDYDWSASSASNYSVQYQPIDFIQYEYSKSLIDYTYHGYYTEERQRRVHNPIIEYYKAIAVHKLKTPECLRDHPFVLFTAGPMGAGKTHTLQWLDGLHLFPLSAFLKISPDRIKKFLPEYQLYLKNDEKNVGRMLRTEVGFLCEVIIWEILYATNVCVWFDSSFRHVDFFRVMFNNLHLRFPVYNIGLLNIKCDRDTVFERAQKRAKITGRHVPEIDIEESIDQVPISIHQLKGLADVVLHIDNSLDSPHTPKLVEIQWNDRHNNEKPVIVSNPTWNMFKQVWSRSKL